MNKKYFIITGCAFAVMCVFVTFFSCRQKVSCECLITQYADTTGSQAMFYSLTPSDVGGGT